MARIDWHAKWPLEGKDSFLSFSNAQRAKFHNTIVLVMLVRAALGPASECFIIKPSSRSASAQWPPAGSSQSATLSALGGAEVCLPERKPISD